MDFKSKLHRLNFLQLYYSLQKNNFCHILAVRQPTRSGEHASFNVLRRSDNNWPKFDRNLFPNSTSFSPSQLEDSKCGC